MLQEEVRARERKEVGESNQRGWTSNLGLGENADPPGWRDQQGPYLADIESLVRQREMGSHCGRDRICFIS